MSERFGRSLIQLRADLMIVARA